MTSRPLMLPIFLSAAVHAAVLSGALLACTERIAFYREMPVFFVTIESPGRAGTIGASGVPRGTGHAPGVPGAILKRPRLDTRTGQDPARHEYAHAPVKEAGRGENAVPEGDAREAPGHRESLGQDGREEGAAAPGAGALQANPGGDGAGSGYGTGTEDGTGSGDGSGAGGTWISSPAVMRSLPKPAYPRYSRTHGEEGTVLLEAEVAADGKPAKVTIIRSSGSRHLDDAALDALERAIFNPARTLGKPVASTRRVSIGFVIKEREE